MLALIWIASPVAGIAAHARGALAHLQDAQAADADAVAFLEVLDDQADQIAEDRFGLLLRKLMIFRKSLPRDASG